MQYVKAFIPRAGMKYWICLIQCQVYTFESQLIQYGPHSHLFAYHLPDLEVWLWQVCWFMAVDQVADVTHLLASFRWGSVTFLFNWCQVSWFLVPSVWNILSNFHCFCWHPTKWSTCGCAVLAVKDLSPTTTNWKFSSTTEWHKITTHVLSMYLINPHFSDF